MTHYVRTDESVTIGGSVTGLIDGGDGNADSAGGGGYGDGYGDGNGYGDGDGVSLTVWRKV